MLGYVFDIHDHILKGLIFHIFTNADWLTSLVLEWRLQLAHNLFRIFLSEPINQCLFLFCKRIREQVKINSA